MHRAPRSIAGFLLLCLLAGCGTDRLVVFNTRGQAVGEIRAGETLNESVILDAYGTMVGKADATTLKNAAGETVGSLSPRGDEVVILGTKGTALGTLSLPADCYDRTQALLGRIGGTATHLQGAAACFFLLLEKN